MDHAATVTVFAFQTYDPVAERYHVAPFKALHELIAARFGGEALEGTAEEVAADELDEAGRYRRIATGWGALG